MLRACLPSAKLLFSVIVGLKAVLKFENVNAIYLYHISLVFFWGGDFELGNTHATFLYIRTFWLP